MLNVQIIRLLLLVFLLCVGDFLNLDEIRGKPLGVGLPQNQVDTVVEYPSAAEFYDNYVRAKKPLVIAGAVKASPAFSKWTDDYFMSLTIPDHILVSAFVRAENGLTGGKTIPTHFQQFVHSYNFSNVCLRHRVQYYLKKDFAVPCVLRCPGMDFVETDMSYCADKTTSPLHAEQYDNLYCVVRGRSEIISIDSKYSQQLSLDKQSVSSVEVDSVDYDKYPDLAQVEYYTAKLSAGDCVYIPYIWTRQIRTYDSNIVVSLLWNHQAAEEVETPECDSCDKPLLFKSVPFSSKGSRSDIDADYVRELILSLYGDHEDSLSFSTIGDKIIAIPYFSVLLPSYMHTMAKSYMAGALKSVDADGDSHLTKGELLACSDDGWKKMVELVLQVNSIKGDADGGGDHYHADDSGDDVVEQKRNKYTNPDL